MTPGAGMSAPRQPWWRIDRIDSASSASSVVTAPPSPVVTILRGWNERQPIRPRLPQGRPAPAGPERARGVLEQHDVLGHGRRERFPVERAAEQVHGEDGARSRADRGRRRARGRGSSSPGRRRRAPAAGPRARRRSRSPGRCTRARAPRRRARARARGSPGAGRQSPTTPRPRARPRTPPRRSPSSSSTFGPHRQLARLEHGRDLGQLLLADVGPREPDQATAGFRVLYHAIVRASPSSSSTFASKSSSSRALSTFGMRSSTSV